MASTSLSLGDYWTKFVREQVASGRYESASAVVRDALRLSEERELRLERLRAALDEADRSDAAPLDIAGIFDEAVARHARKAG